MNREEKFVLYFTVLNRWMNLKNCDVRLSECLLIKGKSVAVYGIGELGKRLLEEFILENVEVKYAVDKHAKILFADLDLYTLEERLPNVDVVVVTPIAEFTEIKKELSKRMDCMIVSLEEIINSLWDAV